MKRLLILSNLLILIVFFMRLSHLPPQIPLFYSQSWGEEQLVDSWIIFILPLLMNGFFFTNEFIYKKLFFENVFVRKVIDCLNLFLIISLTFTLLKIIFLIT